MRLTCLAGAAAAALALSLSAAASADEIPLTTTGTFAAAGSGALTATTDGSGNAVLFNETGQGFAYAVYTLPTPVPIGDIESLTYTVRVNSASTDYAANPVFVIDADETGGINATTNVPSFFYGNNPADLGADGSNAGDAIISSDVNIDANGIAPQPGFVTYPLIGAGSEIEGYYGNNEARNAFDFYVPTWDDVIAQLPHGGVEADDLVHQIYIVNGGSGSFANHGIEIDAVNLTVVPEPAALSLLAAGGLLALRRRHA